MREGEGVLSTLSRFEREDGAPLQLEFLLQSPITLQTKPKTTAGGIAQVVEHLPSKNSNPSTMKNKQARHWWLMPVILVTWVTEIWKIEV
jgi:hypothetical protein